MIEEHESVVLTESISKAGLVAGDVGVVVHVHGHGEAFEVEFMTFQGIGISETLDGEAGPCSARLRYPPRARAHSAGVDQHR